MRKGSKSGIVVVVFLLRKTDRTLVRERLDDGAISGQYYRLRSKTESKVEYSTLASAHPITCWVK